MRLRHMLDTCRRKLCRRMCSPDEAERSIHIQAHPRLIPEYLSLRPCRRAAYIHVRRQTVEKNSRLCASRASLRT